MRRAAKRMLYCESVENGKIQEDSTLITSLALIDVKPYTHNQQFNSFFYP